MFNQVCFKQCHGPRKANKNGTYILGGEFQVWIRMSMGASMQHLEAWQFSRAQKTGLWLQAYYPTIFHMIRVGSPPTKKTLEPTCAACRIFDSKVCQNSAWNSETSTVDLGNSWKPTICLAYLGVTITHHDIHVHVYLHVGAMCKICRCRSTNL